VVPRPGFSIDGVGFFQSHRYLFEEDDRYFYVIASSLWGGLVLYPCLPLSFGVYRRAPSNAFTVRCLLSPEKR